MNANSFWALGSSVAMTVVMAIAPLAPSGCSSSAASAMDGATEGVSTMVTCDGRAGSCATISHGTCVEVRMAPGRCVDWSALGATRCESGAADCPTTFPTGSFGSRETIKPIVACISAGGVAQLAGALAPANPSPGYCSVTQAATDPTGKATCDPDPCGSGGFCSYLKNGEGQSIVSCTWPL